MNRFRCPQSLGFSILILLVLQLGHSQHTLSQDLQDSLKAIPLPQILQQVAEQGNPIEGAAIFHRPSLACATCHSHHNLGSSSTPSTALGPNLANLQPPPSDAQLVEAVLEPSKTIRDGFATVTITTVDGRVIRGMLVQQSEASVRVREASGNFPEVEISADSMETLTPSTVSLMPSGLVNALRDTREFIHLIAYLQAIRDGGPQRARELNQFASKQIAIQTPEYETDIDHAGFIGELKDASFDRGEKIYSRICANCHGTHDREGSLPTSLRFASGKFKNGSDPYSMYRTLTYGYGLMVPQTWMVPEQKYDVIHYIREAYLKPHNTSQYTEVSADYLNSLPTGTSRGPAPTDSQPWQEMDYGPNLIATYEVGEDGRNFAYKGNAIRLNPGPGGVSRGSSWALFDLDTLRVAATWHGDQFIDYRGINFDGAHGIHPRIRGTLDFENPNGPGWANPLADESTQDAWVAQRVTGRDDRQYGPLPRTWAQYRGMYYHGDSTILSYTVGDTEVLETHSLPGTTAPGLVRHFEIGPSLSPLTLQVAHSTTGARPLTEITSTESQSTPAPSSLKHVYLWGDLQPTNNSSHTSETDFEFKGSEYLQVDDASILNMDTKDYTIYARVKTETDGTLFCTTLDQPKWVPNGKSLFIRDGRLTFDIGWVGAVSSTQKINDNRWHDIAVTFRKKDALITFYVDGQKAGEGNLKPQPNPLTKPIARIGFTAKNFPAKSPFVGEISNLQFLQECLNTAAIQQLKAPQSSALPGTIASWNLEDISDEKVPASGTASLSANIVRGTPSDSHHAAASPVVLALAGEPSESFEGFHWIQENEDLRLVIPKSQTVRRFSLVQSLLADVATQNSEPTTASTSTDRLELTLANITIPNPARDLQSLTHGGPARWPQTIQTQVAYGSENGPFAVDVLKHPEANPWLCRMRLTGHDFFEDGDRAAVCDWDGNVWLVKGLGIEGSPEQPATLTWTRIASGLFQPLGLKIIDEKIHLTCRDQLCRLHDLNGDDSIDWIECINNDHQVTEHFHEFAMGLQTDNEGNFYYAKSARHALKAVVPHHGTLLKVTPDGLHTEIVATGFRAANGVCINPDGTFFVTDQEGHWNPKNRVNWVKKGGFYGNMFGYHDVTDSSDSAMESPVCWITNAFDRSPAELLWVESPRWKELDGALLSLSYGYGKVFLVLPQKIDDAMQGGMIELPISQFPTGIIRGRFNSKDGHLYLSGMYSWAGNQQQPGGFYRVRRTSKPLDIPIAMNASGKTVTLRFPHDIDPATLKPENCSVKAWDLKRTANYGSPHLNERSLEVKSIVCMEKTVVMEIPDLAPTWGMEISYQFQTRDGRPVVGTIHNTIHRLAP